MSNMNRRLWTRNELLLAFNLYCKTPFGQIDQKNPFIIELGELINRSPSSVSWKLANFARLDPTIRARGLSGASHGSKGEEEIWNEFNNNWAQLGYESEILLINLKKKGEKISRQENFDDDIHLLKEGKERETVIRARINQGFFRKTILATYSSKCCITGLDIPELLIASHIVPWSKDEVNRVNPKNGLCLNALHDKAYDRGLITIDPDFVVVISKTVNAMKNASSLNFLTKYHGKTINLPDKFVPERKFLEYHNEYVFVG
jgi:putative restriction endonuclease